ncbi:MAG: hypothetical protein ACXWE7_13865, partial [Nitrososphaeraceae archaeon]
MVLESSIDILYYNILTIIVEEYEQVLTAIEIAMTDLEEKSLYVFQENISKFRRPITPINYSQKVFLENKRDF